MVSYIINSAVGAIAGWAAGYFGKGSAYGQIANLVAGAVGGNAGALLPGVLGMAAGAGDTQSMITNGIASLVGGGGLTFLSSFLKKA